MPFETPRLGLLIYPVPHSRFKRLSALHAVVLLGMSAEMSVGMAKESAGVLPSPWSFRPLQSAAAPAVRNAAWPRTPVDTFLLAKMEAANIEPAKPAAPRLLIRRLYFDLIGLPPTSEEVDAFLQSAIHNPQSAIESLVDSLLASPHYGERWARYWLDLARYTDKTPDYLDNSSSAWLYRDWVVKAFNDDMGYDEFVRRQLAVDLMPDSKPEERHALGFLGLSPTYFKELKLPPEIIKGTVADEWEEHVDAVGRTFLGLTLACARCHDHKSDPITAADYYGIAGVFASVRITPVPAMSDELWAPVAKARAEVAKLEKELAELKKKKPAPPTFAAHVAAMQTARLGETEKKIADIKAQTPHYNVPMANGVEDAALYVISAGEKEGTKLDYHKGQARDLEIQKRGNPNQTGDVVKRRFLSAFPAKNGKPREFTTGSGRLELAKAIIEDATSLSARVIVNRVWRHHFGRGLVGTPSEFGAMGEAPTHPELLDDLTARFVANGWSLKWLHREILLSAAWQQDSLAPKSERADPENRLFARMPRRRLDVEAWRDSMLAASGLLDRKSGGPSEELNSEKNHRRTLYGTVNRDELDPMLRINDFPEPSAHSATRPETSTPLQMLFALNSSFLQQQADALAERVGREASQPVQDRVRRAYSLSYQREPTARELAVAAHFFEGRENDRNAWSAYTQALLASNEMLFID
jgi:hypothetical protein